MKQIKSNHKFLMLLMFVSLSTATFSFTNRFGLDTYKIYLNNKLVLDKAVNQPLSTRVLQLGKQSKAEELRISYTHCMTKTGGTGRSISLIDGKGNLLKKWNFKNATSANLNMVIPTKEVLTFEKGHPNQMLSLYYTANEISKSEMLTTISFK